MGKMQKVNDVSQVQVNKFYLVPHIQINITSYDRELDLLVPIIPKWHNDKKDFGFPYSHYHIDGRFIKDYSQLAVIYNVSNGKTNVVLTNEGDYSFFNENEIHYLKRKCIYPEAGLDTCVYYAKPDFVKKYVGKSCKGRKCPHWGVTMQETNGKLLCPMHGLKGCIEKEVIIDITISESLKTFIEYLNDKTNE